VLTGRSKQKVTGQRHREHTKKSGRRTWLAAERFCAAACGVRSAQVISAGQALIQDLNRGHYELGLVLVAPRLTHQTPFVVQLQPAPSSATTTSLGAKGALGCTRMSRTAATTPRLSGPPPSGVSWRATSTDGSHHGAPQPGLARSRARRRSQLPVTAADFDVHLRIVMQIRQHAQGQSRPARRSCRLLGGDPAGPLAVGAEWPLLYFPAVR
jgi:hypothetical protein